MALSVKIESFEGPLDLLLHLIDVNKFNIFRPVQITKREYPRFFPSNSLYCIKARPVWRMIHPLPVKEMPEIGCKANKHDLKRVKPTTLKKLHLLHRIVKFCMSASRMPCLLVFAPLILFIPRWNKVKHISSLVLTLE